MSDVIERELGWDDEIENDSPDFVLLPEGDYDFVVLSYERARHNGSEKLPPCNKAVIKIKIEANEGVAIINHNLMLHTKTEGLLCAFFTGIGQRKRGEKLKMNWNAITGSRGRCKVGIRKWISEKNGREYESNEILRFYDPEENQTATASSTTDVQFKAGSF